MARSATRLRSRLLVLIFGMLAALYIVAATPQMAFAADDGTPNLFMHIVSSAGWVFGPLLLLVSIGLVALIVLLILDLRMGNAVPPGFVEDFTDTVNKSQFKQAYEMAREDGSFLGRVMTAGMARLQYGLEDAREGALNMVDNIKAGKERLDRLPGHDRHAGADARSGRYGVGYDPELHGSGQARRRGRRSRS